MKQTTAQDFLSIHYLTQVIPEFSVLGHPMHCQKILRILPGKRIVIEGLWQEKEVVTKIYFHPRRAKRHIREEKRGVKLIEQLQITTPQLLFSGKTDINNIYVSVFSATKPCSTLKEILEKEDIDKSTHLLKKTQGILAKLHNNNLIHKDFHLNNFFIKDDNIFLLDCREIKKTKCQKKLLGNLALMHRHFPHELTKIRSPLLEIYCEERNLAFKETSEIFEDLITEKYSNYSEKLFKKILRTSEKIVAQKSLGKNFAYERKFESKDLMSLLNKPENFLKGTKTGVIKSEKKAKILKTKLDGREFVIKINNYKGFLYFISHCFKTSRAKNCWLYANLLKGYQINTPEPVAFIEKKFLGLTFKSYFVMRALPGKDLLHYMLDKPSEAVAKKSCALIQKIQSFHLAHEDFKALNFFVSNNEVYILDLDSIHYEKNKKKWLKKKLKDTKRFSQNWVRYPKLAKMFEQYLEARPKE